MSKLGTASLSAEEAIPAPSMAPQPAVANSNDHAMQQAQHSAVISLVISRLGKIQKETKARKFREVYGRLGEAVSGLGKFKEEEWPPRKLDMPSPPEWMQEDGGGTTEALSAELDMTKTRVGPDRGEGEGRGSSANDAAKLTTNELTAAALEDDTPAPSLQQVLAENSDSPNHLPGGKSLDSQTQNDHKNGTTGGDPQKNASAPDDVRRSRPIAVSPPDDDPATREPMHPAVVSAIAALCLVMTNPSKTVKMAELSLDCATVLITNRYVSGRAGGRHEGEKDAGSAEESRQTEEGGAAGRTPTLLQYLIDSITRCSESSSEAVQTAMTKALLALMTSPKCGVHEASMLVAVRATFHVYLVTKSAGGREVAKATLVDMLKSVFNRMEAYDAMTRGTQSGVVSNGHPPIYADDMSLVSEVTHGGGHAENFGMFASQYHTDGYLLFRALCKLSAKAIPGDDGGDNGNQQVGSKLLQTFSAGTSVDPLALQSKILSLELILAVFEHCGEAFRTGEKFIYAVRSYLCVSLLKNCMSNKTTVTYLSLKIFLLLVYKFKTHLKSEIEIFVANIFLRILESPNSSFEQKSLVLEALRALCADPHLLTQLFLNFDCDFDAVNLYKDIVHNLTRLSSRSRSSTQYSSSKKDASQDILLSVAGLEVLVVVLRAFLKALDLPGGDDDQDEEGTSNRIRSNLQLDLGLAFKSEELATKTKGGETDDIAIAAKDIRAQKPTVEAPKGGEGKSPDEVAEKIVGAFDRKRAAQQNFEIGRVKFTLSLKSGLLYFIESGFLSLDAKETAHFFLENKDTLDKTQIGEALGRDPDSSFVKDEGVDAEKGGEGFYVRILHHYVDAMDFTGLEFDSAIRLFLSGFRLPGEAQKIDRIMEKFAEHYTRQNESIFSSADTAFILAFSVIMLNTDLHNPSIKPERRMTVDSFKRSLRGVSVDGGDLPDDFLEGIFSRIQTQPFTLKEDEDAREKANASNDIASPFLFEGPNLFGFPSTDDKKKEMFAKEKQEMMAASEQLFKRRSGRPAADKAASALTESISPADVVTPMFDVTWGPLIGTLSQVLEMSNDEDSIALCLNGFVYSVRIAAHSGMFLARDTFVNSLAKFTTLGSIKEMKNKNIESIRTLLSIAIIDGDYLGDSWGPVLQCISQLGRLQLFASGLASDDKFLMGENPQDEQEMDGGGFFRQPTKAETVREMEENNGRAVLAAVNEVLIDRVFSSTVKLSSRGIVDFLEHLVAVSEGEIEGNSRKGLTDVSTTVSVSDSSQHSNSSSSHRTPDSRPRIYSLQKLVEVADYNMDVRPRIAWSQMWEMMAAHFARIGCHENAMVSMFAIDALRQLSFKFLEKPELSDFNFQRLFLRPFLLIMENPGSREDIRELVLRCVDNMIRSLSHNLRSGWKIFFSILNLTATDPSEKISTLGLAILQRLLDQHLEQLCRISVFEDSSDEPGPNAEEDPKQMSALHRRERNANAEDFVALCRASLAFVQTEETEKPLPIGLSMRALCHTACYADLIADGRVLPPVSGAQTEDSSAFGYTYEGLKEGEAENMILWRPLFDGLAAGICSTAPSHSGGVGCLVQRGSVMTIRAILLRHGSLFTVSQWSVILRQVIIPAIQIAAEHDESPVINMTSESPSLSTLDFLSKALQLPPPSDDEGLLKFAKIAETDESAPTRPLGSAELLVEASFADLRHGGDGNLSRAHGLANKKIETRRASDQPFPDSWIATTAPIALGMLTDILSEMVLVKGSPGRTILWPIVLGQLQRWAVGHPILPRMQDRLTHQAGEPWLPCEALVRVGCRELDRIPQKLLSSQSRLQEEEHIEWAKVVFSDLADTLSKNVDIEALLHKRLVGAKLRALGLSPEASVRDDAAGKDVEVVTPYGKGKLVRNRIDSYENDQKVPIRVISLYSGATLYGPVETQSEGTNDVEGEEDPLPMDPNGGYMEKYLPALKVMVVSAFCLQKHLPPILDNFIPSFSKSEVDALLNALEKSRQVSYKAGNDEDLAHLFQEAMVNEWGDGVEEVEAALSSMGGLNTKGGSKMFFLTQEAGANYAVNHLLSFLYCRKQVDSVRLVPQWDRESYAEPLLLERVMDVMNKFLVSEQNEGAAIDPNVWRMSGDSGGKIAVYCTSFASVVVSMLEAVVDFRPDQFQRHKDVLYPALCALIKVQSEEIRSVVYKIFTIQVAPLAGISVQNGLS